MPGRALAASALVAVGAVAAGCGGSSTQSTSAPAATSAAQSPSPSASTSPATTPTQTTRPPLVSIESAVTGLGPPPEYPIPTNNTCDGGNVPLSITWKTVPHGTAQLVLFILNLRPVNGAPFIDWAVAGLSPSSHGIAAGALPAGAVVGRNSFGNVGYSICPPKGKGETFLARIVALPHPVAVQSGFDTQKLYAEAEQSAKYVGLTGAGTYSR